MNKINPMYWVNKYIDSRISQYGKGVGAGMKYNPLLVSMELDDTEKQFTRRMVENSLWYTGDEQALSYFYRKVAPNFYRFGEKSESLNYFWGNSDEEDFRRVHTGFPQLISEKMVDLIVGNGYNIVIEGDNEEELQEELDEILKDNKLNTLLAKSIETESWSGGVAWKISKNPHISDYPIIEAWEPENYSNVVVSGRVVEDHFYKYYKKNNREYRLTEIYGVDKNGAYIDYVLEELTFEHIGQTKINEQWVKVKLSELEQTKDLKRITFNGYKKRLSLYKPNKLPNSEFRWSTMGESDYAGSYGAFDSIDEIWSTSIQEGRDGKLYRYFPEEFLPKNAKDETVFPSNFKTKHVIYKDSPMDNTEKAKIQYSQGELRTEQHMEKYKQAVMLVLNNAGLSPTTVGISGFESISADADSQQEREKVSIRTRNKKTQIWEEFLEDILPTVLEFHYITKNMVKVTETTFNVPKLPEFELRAIFEDYVIKSKADKTNEVTTGFRSVWDYATAVEYVHSDKTPKEQLVIVANLKLMNNEELTLAEAMALQDSVRMIQEELQEEGVEMIGQQNELGTVTEENDETPPDEQQEEE